MFRLHIKWIIFSIILALCAQGSNNTIQRDIELKNEMIDKLIKIATTITKNGISEREAKMKLIEIGDEATPAILKWLKAEELNVSGDVRGRRHGFKNLIDVISQIASKEARDYIVSCKRIESKIQRDMLMRRIDIWQGENKYEKLIEVFEDGPKYDKKWAIFKLGVLGDKRAVSYLEKVTLENEALDIRETAKDVLAHLNDPNVPLRYIDHMPSQKVQLIPKSDIYRLGEPITIHCKLIAGEYGSQTLVEFSKPSWHFLPWGFAHPDMDKSQPLIINIYKSSPSFRKIKPMKELRINEERLANTSSEPLRGYVDLSDLGEKSSFKLKPKESKLFIIEDISKAFKISEPGEYRVYVTTSGNYSMSDMNNIKIIQKE